MNPRYEHRISGLEQYALERAGYFIRRQAIPSEELVCALQVPIVDPVKWLLLQEVPMSILRDLFRDMARIRPEHSNARVDQGEWHRDFVVDPALTFSDQLAALHQVPPGYRLRIALEADERMLVIPGSHETPMIAPALEDGNNDRATRVRLMRGDLLVYSYSLLRRIDPDLAPSARVLEVIADNWD